MDVLNTNTLRLKLTDALLNGQQSILIASAFISEVGYNWLKPKSEHIDNRTLIGRFSPTDFLTKASSVSCLRLALQDGWKLGINIKLHSKVTIIDDKKIFLGSSNLTANGLGLNKTKQNESNVFFETHSTSKNILDHLLETTQFLNEAHVIKMEAFLNSLKGDAINHKTFDWPEKIIPQLPNSAHFFTSDFPDIPLNQIGQKPSCFFANVENESPHSIFINSNVYSWLLRELKKADTNYTNFGWLTQLIHNSLLDVPPPYRADVKTITAWLFDCIETFSDEIIVKHHRRTKSMHLKI